MMHPMNKLLAFAALLALTACATGATTPSGPRADWRCDGGAAFSMRLTDEGNAEVFAGGQLYNLPGVAAGSGTRYTNGSVEYWEHGDEAMLNGAQGGPYNNCRRG
jgi:membrane-bound inhibitor of C-type lysozyme